jgi:hypothetical protein
VRFRDLAVKAYRTVNAVALGGDITPEQVDIAFDAANDMLDGWAAQRLTIVQTQRKVYPITANKGSTTNPYTIGPGGDLDQPRPMWIPDAAYEFDTPNTPLEGKLYILRDDEWAARAMKSVSGSLPGELYYDHRFPTHGVDTGLGLIYLNPVPNGTQVIRLVLYTPLALTAFADRDATDYFFPPGYAEALRYQLAQRLAIELGFPIPQGLADMAAITFGTIKRPNARAPLLRTGLPLGTGGGWYKGNYNWRSGQ